MAGTQFGLNSGAPYVGEPFSVDELEQIPHLRPLAKSIREALQTSNKTLGDIDLQNKQDYENFVDLFNNNLLFRLIITHQYYLLQSLFQEPGRKGRWNRFLEETGAEVRRHQQEQVRVTLLNTNIGNVTVAASAAAEPVFFNWSHPDPNLSSEEKLKHYEKQIERITIDYHTHRIRLRSEIILIHIQDGTGHLDRMRQALNPSIPAERRAISRLDAIKMDIAREHREIMSRPIYKGDGNFDEAAAILQANQLGKLVQNFNLNLLFHDIPSVNQAVASIRKEQADAEHKIMMQEKSLEHAFEANKNQIVSAMEQCRRDITKNAAAPHIKAIIDAAQFADLDVHQRTTVLNLCNQLEKNQKLLERTQDSNAARDIIDESNAALVQLQGILPESSLSQIRPNIEALAKMGSRPVELAPPLAEHPELQLEALEPEPMQNQAPLAPEPHGPILMPQSEDIDARREQQKQYKVAAAVKSPKEQEMIDAFSEITEKTQKIIDNGGELAPIAIKIQAKLVQFNEFEHYKNASKEDKRAFAEALVELGKADEEYEKFKDIYAPLFEPEEEPSPQANFNS